MKKLISIIMAIAISVSLMTNSIVFANNNIKVTLNGNQIQFDQPPVIRNDRTLVPIRAIFEAMGMMVSWDNTTKKILAIGNDWAISMQIDSYWIAYGSTESSSTIQAMDTTPCIINDRTYVPVRFIAEVTGYDVDWDEAGKTVVITGSPTIPEPAQNDNSIIPETYEVKGSFEYYSAFPDVLDFGKLNNVPCTDEYEALTGYKYVYSGSGKDMANYIIAIKSLGYEMAAQPMEMFGISMFYSKGNKVLTITYNDYSHECQVAIKIR